MYVIIYRDTLAPYKVICLAQEITVESFKIRFVSDMKHVEEQYSEKQALQWENPGNQP